MDDTAPARAAAAISRTPLLTKLNLDWEARYERAERDYGPAGTCAGGVLLAQIRSLRGARQDEVLYRLLEAARDGNRHAERVLVQALLPAAARMAHRIPRLDEFDRADRVGCAIGAAWEAVRTYPMRLHSRVHANLTMRTLHILCPDRRKNDTEVAGRTVAVPDTAFDEIVSPSRAQPVEVRLMRLFTWAVDAGVVNRGQVALLSRAALGDETHAQIASDLGLTVKALRRRVDRIRDRISRAVAQPA